MFAPEGKPRTILTHPDQRLHERSKLVEVAEIRTPEFQQLISDMFTTMKLAEGIGLSAIQIGVPKQVIVVNVTVPRVIINPRWDQVGDHEMTYQEGCLSVPGVYETSSKPGLITIKARNREGLSSTFQARDLEAFCILHEIDHLKGKLFTDDSSGIKEQRYRRTIKKTLRQYSKDPKKSLVYGSTK